MPSRPSIFPVRRGKPKGSKALQRSEPPGWLLSHPLWPGTLCSEDNHCRAVLVTLPILSPTNPTADTKWAHLPLVI